MISLVVPTLNEAKTILELIRRAAQSLANCAEPYEIIIVDDASTDGTAELVESASGEYPVRVVRRNGRLGLASAVVAGWNVSSGDKLGVIDADLQHPPEILEELIRRLEEQKADVAIATRYMEGGGVAHWSKSRQGFSWFATYVARLLLARTLAGVRDPMSGYFVIRREVLDRATLNPHGYKILLEVLARGSGSSVVEVPYVFDERRQGTSKLGPKQMVEYVYHLLELSATTGQLSFVVLKGLVIVVCAIGIYLIARTFVSVYV